MLFCQLFDNATKLWVEELAQQESVLPRSRVSAGCLLSVSDCYRENALVLSGLANSCVGNFSLIRFRKGQTL
jgi:hypothetical protein